MNLGVDSAHPVLTPGPAIFENDPLDMAFPKLSSAGRGSIVRSRSTSLGTIAFVNDEAEVSGDVGNWRKSYTSSVMIKASYFRASLTSFSRVERAMVLPDGFEKVGTQ